MMVDDRTKPERTNETSLQRKIALVCVADVNEEGVKKQRTRGRRGMTAPSVYPRLPSPSPSPSPPLPHFTPATQDKTP